MSTVENLRTFTVPPANADAAYQLAQFCKRIGWTTVFGCTEALRQEETCKGHAHQMLAGMGAVAAGIAVAGFAPR